MKTYVPRPGTLTERAIALLKREGPQREKTLAELLDADRRAIFMCLLAPIKHGILVKTRDVVVGSGRLGTHVEAWYEVPGWDDLDDGRPIRVIVRGPGQLPVGPAAIAASNPFACRA